MILMREILDQILKQIKWLIWEEFSIIKINNYHTDSEVKNKSKTLDYGSNLDNNNPVFENPLTYAVPPGAPSVIPGMIPPAPFPPLAGAPPIPGVPPFAGGPIPGVLPHPFAGPFAPPFGMPGHPIGKFQ